MTESNFVRVDRGGVEFFTELDTGRSGMSGRGFGRAVEVHPSRAHRLIKTATRKSDQAKWPKTDSKRLQALAVGEPYLEKVITQALA